MTILHDPVTPMQQHLDVWDTPYVELDIFATDGVEEIVDIIDTFASSSLVPDLLGI
jgi:hypothetical protein